MKLVDSSGGNCTAGEGAEAIFLKTGGGWVTVLFRACRSGNSGQKLLRSM
jgi:hypothetical protein